MNVQNRRCALVVNQRTEQIAVYDEEAIYNLLLGIQTLFCQWIFQKMTLHRGARQFNSPQLELSWMAIGFMVLMSILLVFRILVIGIKRLEATPVNLTTLNLMLTILLSLLILKEMT